MLGSEALISVMHSSSCIIHEIMRADSIIVAKLKEIPSESKTQTVRCWGYTKA